MSSDTPKRAICLLSVNVIILCVIFKIGKRLWGARA